MAEEHPELVFGLIGAIGTELELVERALHKSLSDVGYDTVDLRLADLLRDLPPAWINLPPRSHPNYYSLAMDAGNKLRADLGRADAMAALAMLAIVKFRAENPAPKGKGARRAYILSSLKRPEEIKLLRDVYGASFFAISAYAPRDSRVTRLASLQAERLHENRSAAHRSVAESLILRDESEPGDYGQDIRKTFPYGDLFVNTSSVRDCEKEVSRFIGLIFGDPWPTPTRDEQGMAIAFLASLRSGSPARQVGAAITDAEGNVQAIGTNEVPSPGGGQYWENDAGDGRDAYYDRIDKSDLMRGNVLSDILSRLRKLGALAGDEADDAKLLTAQTDRNGLLRTAQLFDTIDYVRSVHAEAAALLSGAGRTRGSTLYVTTFPCHECARHIVFAGVARVIYLESYPKSLVSELYRDSISIDPIENCGNKVRFSPFSGISPSIYQHLFSLTKKMRKLNDGTLVVWNGAESFPRLHNSYSEPAIIAAEADFLLLFEPALLEKGVQSGKLSGNTGEGVASLSSSGGPPGGG